MRLKEEYLVLLTQLELLLLTAALKCKTSNITNLATTTALTAVENKTPNVSNLVKKN